MTRDFIPQWQWEVPEPEAMYAMSHSLFGRCVVTVMDSSNPHVIRVKVISGVLLSPTSRWELGPGEQITLLRDNCTLLPVEPC